MIRNARVVTTGSIEGWTINEYKGLVSAHVATGINIFSDIAASFRDVFGGRSRGYAKQLRSLQSEVAASLSEQANRLGANWVIGAHIDFDEISGSGIQMLMVTAQGTAVFASPIQKERTPRPPALDGAVSADELAGAVVRAALVRSALDGILYFSDETWESLTEHRVEEALPSAVRHVSTDYGPGDPELERARKNLVALLHAIPVAACQRHLHKALEQDDCAMTAMSIIQQESLLDLSWVAGQLGGSDISLKQTALQLLTAHAPAYDRTSLELLDAIVAKLTTAFPDLSVVIDKKGIFAKQGAKQWLCSQCSGTNELSDLLCSRCRRDRRGLGEEFTPEKIIPMLQSRIECLRVALAEETTELAAQRGAH